MKHKVDMTDVLLVVVCIETVIFTVMAVCGFLQKIN